jgi:iron complex transport system substrate-binding protein
MALQSADGLNTLPKFGGLNMKKKTITISILLAASLTVLSGCGASGTDTKATYEIGESGTWTDGTYTERAKGKNGNFDVTVVIENGTISNVTVGDNKETPDKGGVAIDQLPEQIVEMQSYEVDAVSGATVTSDGIKEAVAKCLEKASQ